MTALAPHIDTPPIAPPVVLVDGSYYLFRCFFGLPPLSISSGLPTHAVRGVMTALSKLIATHQPIYMAVAFDLPTPTFRHTLSPTYKANRPPIAEELVVQIPYVKSLIKAMGIAIIEQAGYEADDILGTLAHKAVKEGHQVLISTGDKDMTQLVSPNILLEDSFRGVVMDTQAVVDKFGVYPHQMVDYLTLMGDASDGIAGVPKVGAKTATRLLQTYGTLDNILANADKIGGAVGNNLAHAHAQIAIDKQLASIVSDVDLPHAIESLQIRPDGERLAVLFETLEFQPKVLHNLLASLGKSTADRPSDSPSDSPSDNQALYEPISVATPQALERLLDTLSRWSAIVIHPITHTPPTEWQQAQLASLELSHATDSDHAGYRVELTQLDPVHTLSALSPILTDPRIGKIGYDIKHQTHLLRAYGVTVAGWQMDLMLAAYVLSPTLSSPLQALMTTCQPDDPKEDWLPQTLSQLIAHPNHSKAQLGGVLYRHFVTLWQDEPTAHTLTHAIEMPVAQLLTQMEHQGILVNKAFLMQLSQRFEQQIRQLQDQAHMLAGEAFNVASPKQLGQILFDKLGIKGGKKTKSGQYSTSESTLSQIDHPLVAVVLEHRSLSKLKSTYTDSLDKVADRQGRVHTTYHQALTSTGRLSSSNPNLQNIPIRTATGRLIRTAFVAPQGRVMVSADYSQIELRLMAHFSGDARLIEAFGQGVDIHTKTASEILAKPMAAVTAQERRSAKAVNFGLLYGMSSFGLAKQLGVSRAEAQAYIERYFDSYPTIKDYMTATKEQALTQGYVDTLLGRKLYLPQVHSTNRIAKEAALRAAINAPLQGSAADIIKLAMIAVNDILPKKSADLLLQVHDELVFEVDQGEAQAIGEQIKHAMQEVLAYANTLGFEASLSVPLVVDIGIGDNWELAH